MTGTMDDISSLPANVKPDQHIALVRQAHADIDAAVTVDAVHYICDQWDGIADYARKTKNKQIEADAREIKKRAERKIGQLMKAHKEKVGFNKGGRPKTGSAADPVSEPKPPTLAQAGVGKHLADAARKEAAKSEEEFEADLAEKRADILNDAPTGFQKRKRRSKWECAQERFGLSIGVVKSACQATAVLKIPLLDADGVAPILEDLEEARTALADFIQRIESAVTLTVDIEDWS
jgi:hypothetical protein